MIQQRTSDNEFTVMDLRLLELALLRQMVWMESHKELDEDDRTTYTKRKAVESEIVMGKILRLIKRLEFESDFGV